jgi:glycosyltransferase involved in cell wall biosynthesis
MTAENVQTPSHNPPSAGPSRAPKVSIGLPVYNGERYLARALESLLSQTFADFEIIVSDNASTDRTPEIIQEFARQDPRIRWRRNEVNVGASRNFNQTFEAARGVYFKWAAHDDMCAPTFLQACVDALDQDPSAVLSYTRTRVVDEQGRLIRLYTYTRNTSDARPEARFAELLSHFNWCYEIFGLIRAEALRASPMLGSYAASDEVLLAFLALRGPFHEVPQYLFLSREHAQQSIQMRQDRAAYSVWFCPALAGKVLLPYWRRLIEYRRVIRHAPVRRGAWARCHGALARWCLRYKWFLAAELCRAVTGVRASRNIQAAGVPQIVRVPNNARQKEYQS